MVQNGVQHGKETLYVSVVDKRRLQLISRQTDELCVSHDIQIDVLRCDLSCIAKATDANDLVLRNRVLSE